MAWTVKKAWIAWKISTANGSSPEPAWPGPSPLPVCKPPTFPQACHQPNCGRPHYFLAAGLLAAARTPGRVAAERQNGRKSAPKSLKGIVFCRPFRFHSASRNPTRFPSNPHAPVPLFPADPARDAERGGDRLPPADAARRHDAAGGGRHLCVAAARACACCNKITPDRARGAEPRRRDRTADADHPVGRSVARERALRRLRQGDAAHQGPARARHALRADQRGDDHRDLPRLCALLQGSAAQPLSHPVEIPRRGAAALRR